MSFFVRPGPSKTFDFKRIINLPQRDGETTGKELAPLLTEALKTEIGTMELWPLQALALSEAYAFDGVFVTLPVGQGKTIVSFLLPIAMEATCAVLIVPGNLRKKTIFDFEELSLHWRKHNNYQIITYEQISTQPDLLYDIEPDLIIADEAHKLKNKKAGCTKRVIKYWKKSGNTRFVPLSGTLATRSFYDYWHLQLMALPEELAVLPYDYKECELWANALDVKPTQRASLGALSYFGSDLDQARAGFGEHIKNVPGVIASDSSEIPASLIISIDTVYIKRVYTNYDLLEKKWELPNGHDVCTATEKYRHAREISCGFYYVWVEQPPDAWSEARTDYGRFVREKLRYSRRFETPSQIDGYYCDEPCVSNWKRIEKTFTPVTEPVWFSGEALDEALYKVDENTLVWFKHRAIGEAISIYTDIPVFSNGGLEAKTKKHIYENKKGPAAVSMNAMSEGFNLQRYSRNIMIGGPANGRSWEQIIGRTHRSGQEADEVWVHVQNTLPVNLEDFKQAVADAKYIKATTSQQQKLTIADIIERH